MRNQLPRGEADALRELNRRRAACEITLYTSTVTKEEIAKVPAKHRQPHEELYEMYESIQTIDEEFLMPRMLSSLRSGMTSGPIVQDEALGRLLLLGLDKMDARHVFQAAKNELHYFITRDEGIRKRAAQIRSAVGITALLPSELLLKLSD